MPSPLGDGAVALQALLRRGACVVGRAICAPVSLFVVTHGRAAEAAQWPAPHAGSEFSAADTARAVAVDAVAQGATLRRDGYLALMIVGDSGVAGVVVVHPRRGRGGVPRSPVPARGVANAARLVADTLAAHERALVAESAVTRYERWFVTQDRHIRVLDRERQKFAALVNQSGTSCYVADANGRISWTNKTLADSGVANGESWTGQLCRAACASLAGGESFACQDCPVDAAVACGGVVRRELRADGAHGSRTLYVTAVPVKDPDGSSYETLVMVQDLTDLEVLRDSEARKSAMLESALDAVISIDASGRITEFNPAAEHIFGYQRDAALGRVMADLIIPDAQQAAHRDGLAHCVDTGESHMLGRRVEVTGRRADGTTLPLELSIARLPSAGAPMFTGFLRDLTEQKRAEEELRIAEQKLATVVANAPLVLFALDRTGSFTLSEGRGLAVLGLVPGQVVGQSVFDIYRDHPRVLECVRRALGGEEFTGDVAVSGLTFRSHFTPIRASDGTLDGLIGVSVDITEAKRLESQLRHAQKMDAVGRLAGGVAHDFNNLLTVIMGHSELLSSRLGADNPHRGHALEIHKAGRRGGWLTRQLLAFSRNDIATPALLDLAEVATEMERMLRRLIGEDIELATCLGPAGRVCADLGQLEQVIMNLALNARDAMPQGGRLTLELGAATLDGTSGSTALPAGPYAVLTVRDTGCGMHSETLQHAFEPFFTTKEQGKGTGLGLSIVYGIVQSAGGDIVIDSEVGRGTAIHVYFPAVAAEATIADAAPPPEDVVDGSETILLVEDEEGVRALTQEILAMSGYRVLVAASAAEGLSIAAASAGTIHLLLSDVIMPEMGGGEMARLLLAERPDLRVIFMSGYTDDAVIRQGVRAEGTPFLQKPFAVESLLRKVREVLDSAKTPVILSVPLGEGADGRRAA